MEQKKKKKSAGSVNTAWPPLLVAKINILLRNVNVKQ